MSASLAGNQFQIDYRTMGPRFPNPTRPSEGEWLPPGDGMHVKDASFLLCSPEQWKASHISVF
jgi:hypothetical protein